VSLHTHQAGATGKSIMITTHGFDRLPPAAKSAEVELPKADEAVKYLGGIR